MTTTLPNLGFLSNEETWADQQFGNAKLAVFLTPILLATGLLLGLARTRSWLRIPLFIFASVSVYVSLTHVSPHPQFPELWAGFGLAPTLIAVLVAASYVAIKRNDIDAKIFNSSRFALGTNAVAVFFLVPYLTVYIQPPNGLINLGDTTYHVLDELLAPSQGAVPYSNYSPQYTGALGWLVAPLLELPFTNQQKMMMVVLISNLFNVLLPIFVVLIVRTVITTTPRIITFASAVSIWTVSGSQRGGSVHLREFSHFARFIPIFFALWVLARMLVATQGKQPIWAVLSGVCSFIAVFNSADFGLGFKIALVSSLTLAVVRRGLKSRLLLLHLSSFVASTICVLLVYGLLGRSFSVESWVGLRSGVRTLYGTGQLDGFGPHLIVMSIAVCSTAVGLNVFLRSNAKGIQIAVPTICLIIGLWLLVLVGRFLLSPQAANTPPLFLPSFIAFVLIFNCLTNSREDAPRPVGRLTLMPVLVVACLPVGVLWHMPDPRDELLRISGRYVGTTNWSSSPGRVSDGWSQHALSSHIELVSDTVRRLEVIDGQKLSVGYFGTFGHTIELLTGVDNVLGIPAPESLRFGTNQKELACIPIDERAPNYVLVYASPFPCSNYELDARYSTDEIMIFKKLEEAVG